MVKVISISTDKKIFDENSSVYLRSLDYATKLEELHIVVFALNQYDFEPIKKGNLFIYPTNSFSKISYIFDAIKIGRKIIKDNGLRGTSAVITCQDPFETGIVGAILERKYHLPLQIQIHTDFLSSYFKNNLLNRVRVFISNFTLKRADGLRVVSSVILDSIRNRFPKIKTKIDILPIFVDFEKIKQIKEDSNKPFPLTIFMMSRLSKEKKIDTAILAFKNLLDKIERLDVGLYIAGSGEEKYNLKNLVEKLGLEKNIKFHGWEPNPYSLYKKSDIFLLTSEFEGYGMTLIEAAASGLPIVTTKVGVAKTELFKDGVNSYVCEVGDIDCLSNGLKNLIIDKEKHKLFNQGMQDSIKNISIKKEEYVVKYVSFLEGLLKKQK